MSSPPSFPTQYTCDTAESVRRQLEQAEIDVSRRRIIQYLRSTTTDIATSIYRRAVDFFSFFINPPTPPSQHNPPLALSTNHVSIQVDPPISIPQSPPPIPLFNVSFVTPFSITASSNNSPDSKFFRWAPISQILESSKKENEIHIFALAYNDKKIDFPSQHLPLLFKQAEAFLSTREVNGLPENLPQDLKELHDFFLDNWTDIKYPCIENSEEQSIFLFLNPTVTLQLFSDAPQRLQSTQLRLALSYFSSLFHLSLDLAQKHPDKEIICHIPHIRMDSHDSISTTGKAFVRAADIFLSEINARQQRQWNPTNPKIHIQLELDEFHPNASLCIDAFNLNKKVPCFLPSSNLLDSLAHFVRNIQSISPNHTEIFPLSIMGSNYILWSDPSSKTVHLQPEGAFYSNTNQYKFSIQSKRENNYTFFWEGSETFGIPEILSEFLPTIMLELEKLREEYNTICKDFLSTYPSFTLAIKTLAPDFTRALTLFDDNHRKYYVWWDDVSQTANIQPEETLHIDSSHNRYKLSINLASICPFFWNDKPVFITPQLLSQYLNFFVTGTTEVRAEYDALISTSNRFNPSSLSLMNAFFRGPLGAPYRFEQDHLRPAGISSVIIFGDHLSSSSTELASLVVGWMRVKTITVPSSTGTSSTNRKEYYINFQLFTSFVSWQQTNKIGIQVTNDGQFISLFIDNHPGKASSIFSSGSQWNTLLSSALEHFLTTKALSLQGTSLNIHPCVLSSHPETVLNTLCNYSSSFIIPRTTFLNADLTSGAGVDAGGLRNQLITNLSQCLLDGSSCRVLKVNAGIPEIRNLDDSSERSVLSNLGKLFFTCFRQRIITGRVLPDYFFPFLQRLVPIRCSILNNERLIIELAKEIAIQSHLILWDIFTLSSIEEMSDELKSLIFDILLLVDNDDNPTLEDIQKEVHTFLIDAYKHRVISAHIIALSIPETHISAFIRDPSLSTTIQGLPLSPESIIDRIEYTGSDPIILIKIRWLKEFIRSQPEDWLSRFLFTVTGSTTISARTKICISNSSDNFCHAHTCFQTINIPVTHTDVGSNASSVHLSDKDKFFNNLELTMGESGFDAS